MVEAVSARRKRAVCGKKFPLGRQLAIWILATLILPAGALGSAPRVVILGFDGIDYRLTEQFLAEGRLPNLARLREQGTLSPLRSTVPSQTPVSWSTFSTGLHPGRHAIFDFLKRDPATYRPSFAAFDEGKAPFLFGAWNGVLFGAAAALFGLILGLGVGGFLWGRRRAWLAGVALAGTLGLSVGWVAANWLPVERPVAINRQQGDTFWELLGKAGKRVRVLRMPVTFPPEPYEHGELLAGLGTPDLSFRIGKPFYFTSELFFEPRSGNEISVEIVELVDNRGTIDAEIKGPPNKLFPGGPDYLRIPIRFVVSEDRQRLGVEVSGVRLELRPGEWSPWVRFVFPFNPLVKLSGIGRFRVLSLDPEVRVYLSPIQFDPSDLPPVVDVTHPRSFASQLVNRFGLFKTIGWMVDTWSMKSGTIDEEVFFEDTEFTVASDEKILSGLLEDDWDVYFHYFEFPDRIQHIMWRHIDPEHPLYTEEGNRKYGHAIPEAYQRMDRIIGMVLSKMPKDAWLFVASDHGFAPWRRSMNYNTWLAREGYLVLKGESDDRANLEELFDRGTFFQNVDWLKTRAYAMGLGNIYINLKGREAQGVVEAGSEYQHLINEIREKLLAYVDPETGLHPVAYVYTRDEAYGTYDPALIPDLFPANSSGYRVGWQDSLGIVARQIVEPNLDVWSADHCSVYPPLVDGILASNRKLAVQEKPYMADLVPTLLELYGVSSPVQLDGKSLLVP